MTNDIADAIRTCGLVPVIELEHEDQAAPLAMALLQGGLPLAEITFRTAAAAGAIRRMTEECPEIIVGAGSVLNPAQAETAAAAGARFIVSPGLEPGVVRWCLEHNLTVVPGVATPSEIMVALTLGVKVLKFFPAEMLGGPKALKALAAPFPGVKFIPTGGITVENIGEYLKMPVVFACGGSWIVAKKLLSEGRYDEVTRLTIEALDIVHSVRGEQ